MNGPILRTVSLTRAFGGFLAVNGVSLEIGEGRTVALIGPNGAGKTTFYNMISGRLRPTAGRILFRGRDITGWPPHRITREGISRSFQITNIFGDLTVQQNVEVALIPLRGKSLRLFHIAALDEETAAEAREILARLRIDHLAGERAGTLSHGDKRLVELAIVLATEPRLVLLDEPTAGMTPEETRAVIRLLADLAESGPYTFFITEHDMSVVFELAERIFVMHRGELLAEGAPEEIRRNRDVRAAYLGEEEAA